MSREWVDDGKKRPKDKRWVMRCDRGLFGGTGRCATGSEPSVEQPELWQFVAQGWFIAKLHGDICPPCLASGVEPAKDPHRLMSSGVSDELRIYP